MSRICVKNIPRYVQEDRIKDMFSQKGEVTDAKVMRSKDGRSRQFAFIGYHSEAEAQEAIMFFNGTFIDTCRITCEVAHKIGDPDAPRPWSRYSANKRRMQKDEQKMSNDISKDAAIANGNIVKSKTCTTNVDPELQEFLKVMEPRTKTKFWVEDCPNALPSVQTNKQAETVTGGIRKPLLHESSEAEGQIDIKSIYESRLNDSMQTNSLHELSHQNLSDFDYYKSKIKKQWLDSDDVDVPNGQNVYKEPYVCTETDLTSEVHKMNRKGGNMVTENSTTDSEIEQEQALESGRLFVRNLPYMASEEDLRGFFSQYGEISDVHLVLDKDTKRSKGFAYILYAIPESAVRALADLDNSIFQGRLLHVMPAKQPPPSERHMFDSALGGTPKMFKKQREEQKRTSEANGNTRAWNSLFMRSDTVIENIARKYCVSKKDYLDREADDLAVRVALGETDVVAETKQALANAGVNVESLVRFASSEANSMKRSNHVILVKNLPYRCSEADLSQMFCKYGSLDKVILPATRTLALIVFLEASEARAAFKHLAYKRYRDVPLYLEWPPEDILTLPSELNANLSENPVVGEKDVRKIVLEEQIQALPDVDLDHDRVELRSIFVKNLNFTTTDDSLRKHFAEKMNEGKIQSVKIKKHVKNGKSVSMGFGFIEFDSVETASAVFRNFQGIVLDNHALILQLCHPKKSEVQAGRLDENKNSTKLIVRNVAFEATKKDLRQLFSAFGEIKTLRLPKKMGGHRGFAFVEYVTKQEAKNALLALSSTHLYGRHLVLERAKEGESLDELRARITEQFGDQQVIKVSKKQRLT